MVGIARLSSNWLVRKAATVYVETLRNIPPLLVIFFVQLAVILNVAAARSATPSTSAGSSILNNRELASPSPVDGGAISAAYLVLLGIGARRWPRVAVWRTRGSTPPVSRTTGCSWASVVLRGRGGGRLPRPRRAVRASRARGRDRGVIAAACDVHRLRRAAGRRSCSTRPATSPRSCGGASRRSPTARRKPPTRSACPIPAAPLRRAPPGLPDRGAAMVNQFLNLTKNTLARDRRRLRRDHAHHPPGHRQRATRPSRRDAPDGHLPGVLAVSISLLANVVNRRLQLVER